MARNCVVPIRHRRLDRGRRDLSEPRLSLLTITSIAARWGFRRPADFSPTFHRHTGISPQQHRHKGQ
ncbi:helix-turn-helix domain-containing protein [Amycolatopsis sp. RTGN1]|uniref:helix-turn-helix domain-containing protein n=1 Tax=Amycolatopsis ponsaeliensis TaxID=2992142 RepID=UPI003307930E